MAARAPAGILPGWLVYRATISRSILPPCLFISSLCRISRSLRKRKRPIESAVEADPMGRTFLGKPLALLGFSLPGRGAPGDVRDRAAGGHDDPETHRSGTHSRPPGPDRMELKDSHKPVDDSGKPLQSLLYAHPMREVSGFPCGLAARAASGARACNASGQPLQPVWRLRYSRAPKPGTRCLVAGLVLP